VKIQGSIERLKDDKLSFALHKLSFLSFSHLHFAKKFMHRKFDELFIKT